ncbi:Ubiquitin domain-containing protein UBFD1 [Armadillidium vulgare]|nr:Ubiquitin domain-containing protein UBFD1 [Armadillidium vulgare]
MKSIRDVLPTMQKVMIKGLAKDDKTLQELGVIKGAKLMVVGSKLNDVVNVNVPKSEVIKNETVGVTQREPLCKQKMHRKVLDKGIPEDALPGIKNCKEALPLTPLTGMVNKHGGKVRLTFKLELDQVWLGTKERTEKINMSSIQQIVSEKIEEHEEYHVMGLQLGPTEASLVC